MNRKRETIFMGIGSLAGMALCDPTAQAADYLTVHPTTQTFYLNGERMSLTAYLIGGSNYVRLRDIGKAVDFGVTYDAATNSSTSTAHSPTRTRYSPHLPSPRKAYRTPWRSSRNPIPSGAMFPTPYRSTSNGPYYRGTHCSGWATLCSDAAFGDLPWWQIYNPCWVSIQVDGVIDYQNEYSNHAIVVIEKTDEYVKVTKNGINNYTLGGWNSSLGIA